jgi:adenosylcobinamide hydrolase
MLENADIAVNPFCRLRTTAGYSLLTFARPMTALSCCVLNGGLQTVRHVLNLKVTDDDTILTEPADTLSAACAELGLQEATLGMMTAASMNSLRQHTCRFGDLYFSAIVTAGMSNARRAGDPADAMEDNAVLPPGTINLVVCTNASLTPAAMAEALMIATEAKVAALGTLQIRSTKSGEIATGTGTDAIAIISDPDGIPLRYVGKHVPAGEILAQAVILALTQSLQRAK